MSALPGSVDVGAGPFRSQIRAEKTQSLRKWQIQVKLVTARITVLRQFEGFECRVSSGSAVGSAQTVLRKLEKSHPSESTGTKNPAGALGSVRIFNFSTYWSRAEDEPNQKGQALPSIEQGDREGLFCKARDVIKELPIHPVVLSRILLTLLIALQILKEDPPEDSGIVELVVVMAIVIVLAQEMEGINMHLAPKDLMRGISQIPINKQLLFLSSLGLLMRGANAEDQTKSRKAENSNAGEIPHYAKAAVVTLVAVLTIGGAGVARRMCNRWRPRRVVQVPGANVDIDAALENSVWNRRNEELIVWEYVAE